MRTYKPSTLLRRAKKLIEKPEKWGKGLYKNGGKYCALGALYYSKSKEQALKTWEEEDVRDAEVFLRRATPRLSVAPYNDAPRRKHADIMRLFDRAIDLAVKAGK